MTTSASWKSEEKAPTASGIPVMNKAQRDWLRTTKAFKDRNTLWSSGTIPGTKNHRFNAYSRVGKLAEIIAEAQPKSYNEFANYYLKNIHSWETVQAQANEWYEYAVSEGYEITPAEALAEHIIHIIDQTWEGWEREEVAAKNLTELLKAEIGRPSYEWDVDYAIDLVKVEPAEPDGFIEGFQIKPTSFFTSPRQGVAWARKSNAKKHRAAEAKGKKVWFVDGDQLDRGNVSLIHWSELPE